MLEYEIFTDMFIRVFLVMAVIVMVSMPFAFIKMKQGENMGFIALYSTITFCLLNPILAGHIAVINAMDVKISWTTYVLGVNAIVSAFLFWRYFLRIIFK